MITGFEGNLINYRNNIVFTVKMLRNGESVDEISKKLNIPLGEVLEIKALFEREIASKK
jgi:hypothetical protein